jgi:hypothetical protein
VSEPNPDEAGWGPGRAQHGPCLVQETTMVPRMWRAPMLELEAWHPMGGSQRGFRTVPALNYVADHGWPLAPLQVGPFDRLSFAKSCIPFGGIVGAHAIPAIPRAAAARGGRRARDGGASNGRHTSAHPAGAAMLSERRLRRSTHPNGMTMAMPSARPPGGAVALSGQRRLRPRRRGGACLAAWSSGSLPQPSCSPGGGAPWGGGGATRPELATWIVTGYVKVRMVSACDAKRAGRTSMISMVTCRRMAAGSFVLAVSRNVARSVRARVSGWMRLTQALPASRYSAVERCQACAGMPRSSSSTQ